LLSTYPALQAPATQKLVIAGPTDTEFFSKIIQQFQQRYPTVEISYFDIGTLGLYEAITNGDFAQLDLAVISATHLQLKLVNDGYAQTYSSTP